MTTLTTQYPIRLVQITDTHLYGTASGTLLKMNTQHSSDRVLALVQENESNIDLVLATGDIAQDASPKAYSQFLESIAVLDTPFRWIPGNHDSASIMQQVDRQASDKLVQINNWMLLFLDTSIEGQVHGKLAAEEQDFLRTSLDAAERDSTVEHCLICLHHNPTEGNAGWMKDIGLQEGEKFFDQLGKFKKPRCVIYGHVHQELDYQHKGLHCMCTPSTCIQFKPNVDNFALDRLTPGYRGLTLHQDGRIDTKVYRIEGFESDADFDSTGY